MIDKKHNNVNYVNKYGNKQYKKFLTLRFYDIKFRQNIYNFIHKKFILCNLLSQ